MKFVIIGAGIVGLSIAETLIKKEIVSHLKISVPTYKKNKIPNELKLIPISTPGSRFSK